MESVVKYITVAVGGVTGWFVGEFKPAFPLILVAMALIFYDAWTAFQLDRRVHKKYPEKTRREKAHFTSFAFGKVITQTIPKRLILILLAYAVEKYVFVHIDIPLSYIITGGIVFEQGLSILENEASCRDTDRESMFFRLLKKILIDKTERHFDIDLTELKDKEDETIS